MATSKQLNSINLTAELSGGVSSDGKSIIYRRTLADVSDTVTPDQAYGALLKIFALQKHPIAGVGQVEKFELYTIQ